MVEIVGALRFIVGFGLGIITMEVIMLLIERRKKRREEKAKR